MSLSSSQVLQTLRYTLRHNDENVDFGRFAAFARSRRLRVRLHGGNRKQIAAQLIVTAANVHLHVRLQFPLGSDRIPARRGITLLVYRDRDDDGQ